MALATAVVMDRGLSSYAIKSMLVLLALLVIGPVLALAIAHMARVREHGGVRIQAEERVE